MLSDTEQLFFRPEEWEQARFESFKRGWSMYVVVDSRSHNPRPLMIIVGIEEITAFTAKEILHKAKLWKRMWVLRRGIEIGEETWDKVKGLKAKND